ncbi:MAG: hypothetical protein R6W74_07245, partial [Nitrosomonas halophila]
SSSLLMQEGLTESLAGRFFLHRCTHWSYPEARDAFGWSLERWIYFGGYPGAVSFTEDEPSWKRYIADSLIETVLARDVLQMSKIAKPVLLRHLFALAATLPAQCVSYNKMLASEIGRGAPLSPATVLQKALSVTHKFCRGAFFCIGCASEQTSGIKPLALQPKRSKGGSLLGGCPSRNGAAVMRQSDCVSRNCRAVGAPDTHATDKLWEDGMPEEKIVITRWAKQPAATFAPLGVKKDKAVSGNEMIPAKKMAVWQGRSRSHQQA